MEVEALIRCSERNRYFCSPHHQASEIDIRILVTWVWCIKFYFTANPDPLFISFRRVYEP